MDRCDLIVNYIFGNCHCEHIGYYETIEYDQTFITVERGSTPHSEIKRY